MSKDSEPIPWANAAVLAEKTGAVQWLWQPWIPCGHITFLAGEPGVGKSAVALYFAACVSNGAPWPDGTTPTGDRAPVLIADSEGAQAIWTNRIRDWQIDDTRIFFPGADAMGRLMLDDEKVIAGVQARIVADRVRLVIVDSLRTSLPATVDENSSAVGSVLARWADLCRDTGIALVIVHHFGKPRKDQSREATLDRLRGSSAIGAMARSVIAVDRPDAEDDRVRLSCVKNNLALLPEPLGLQIGGSGIDWTDEAPSSPRRELVIDRAREFLMAKLQRGPVASSDLVSDAEAKGISQDSIYRARKKMALVSVFDPADPRHRRTLWALPVEADRDLQLVK